MFLGLLFLEPAAVLMNNECKGFGGSWVYGVISEDTEVIANKDLNISWCTS